MQNTIVKEIYPKENKEGDLMGEQPEKEYPLSLDNSEHRINKYVFVDFLSTYDADTMTDSLDEKGRKLYVARIKIKKGHPRELYHIIKDDVPVTFLREGTNVKKKDMK